MCIPQNRKQYELTLYECDVVFATDYYPFGSPMSWSTTDSSGGRLYSGEEYRYGFNGQEKDDEVAGEGNQPLLFKDGIVRQDLIMVVV